MRTQHRLPLRLLNLESRAVPAAFADFDADGFGDLAIADPVGGIGGSVHIVYGSAGGLETSTAQHFTPASFGIDESIEPDVHFGESLATGDFNADGFTDLAIGIPLEDTGRINNAGVVRVVFGSPDGLTPVDSQIWTQDSRGISNSAEADDRFGSVLAAGDFDGDDVGDLAIGVARENAGKGIVHVIYGLPDVGLSAAGSQVWSQNSANIRGTAEIGDNFGDALAVGDFDGNGRDDLAIGVPAESIGKLWAAGAVNVIYGTPVGLKAKGNQLWSQDSLGLEDEAETGDRFGSALAAGDFDGNGADDLAIGIPFESFASFIYAGMVQVLYGKGGRPPVGLTAAHDQTWIQMTAPVTGDVETYDKFGQTLAAGDFDGDGNDDLAIGVPYESVGNADEAGEVDIIYGSEIGLFTIVPQPINQTSPGVATLAESMDHFAAALSVGDFNSDGKADLAIGVPGELLGTGVDATTGLVQVLLGGGSGLASEQNQLITPLSIGLDDSSYFGAALAAS